MSKKPKCLYTNVLNSLTMLDEKIFEMQASLAKVRELVNDRFDVENEEESPTLDATSNPTETKVD